MFQVTKQAYVYSYNRHTGAPIWPIIERPAPQSKVPGEKLAATQPHPTKPAPLIAGPHAKKNLIDFTPADLSKLALERAQEQICSRRAVRRRQRHRGNAEGRGPANTCGGGNGGANIVGPPAADPTTGVMFVASDQRLLTGAAGRRRSERDNAPDDREDSLTAWAIARGAAGVPPATEAAGRTIR